MSTVMVEWTVARVLCMLHVCLAGMRVGSVLYKPCHSSPAEDVVTCDRCGWMTHEDCYGIAPLEGEEETEGEEVPWFCDSCKMGVQPVRHAHMHTHT